MALMDSAETGRTREDAPCAEMRIFSTSRVTCAGGSLISPDKRRVASRRQESNWQNTNAKQNASHSRPPGAITTYRVARHSCTRKCKKQ